MVSEPRWCPCSHQSRGPGLCHIKEQFSEHDVGKVLADYAGKGVAVTLTGQFVRDFHVYLGTAPILDFVYELGNCPIQDLPPEMVTVYPPPEMATLPRVTKTAAQDRIDSPV